MATRILHRRGKGIPSADDFSSAGEILIDTETGTGYTLRETDGSVVALGGDGSGSSAGMILSPTEPTDPITGTLWMDATSGEVWVWVESKWLQFPVTGGKSVGGMAISETEPADKVNGMQWMDANTGIVFIWDVDKWLEFPK
jgi:hypothetical protein